MENNDAVTKDIGNVYLNALAIALSKSEILTVKIESDEKTYSECVKPWLEDTVDITYWTPRRKLGAGSIYTSYVTSINSSIDHARSYLEEKLKDRIDIKGNEYLTIDCSNIKIIEGAITKRFIATGWYCSKRYGNIVCCSPDPLNSKYLFTFYRTVEFRVIYINNPLIVLRPHLRVVGPSLKDLLNEFSEEVLQKVTNRECVALRRDENRYRKAMVLEIKKTDIGRYMAKVVFCDGVENEVDIGDVRLAGNVLFYKKLVTELFGERAFKQLEKMQRSYSFSLGSRESSLRLARSFKDEILNIIRGSKVFPFRLGDVDVDIKLELFRAV